MHAYRRVFEPCKGALKHTDEPPLQGEWSGVIPWPRPSAWAG